MFFAALYFSLISLCYATSNITAALPNHQALAKKPLMPKGWESHSLKRATDSKLQQTATGYLNANLYFGDETCTKQVGVYAQATGVCFVAVDEKGNEVGTMAYSFLGSSKDGLTIVVSIWDNFACSGEAVSTPVVVPEDCVGSDDFFIAYSYVAIAEPWSNYPAGVMFGYYPSEETCAADLPSGLYGWYGLHTCIATTDDDGSPFFFSFSQCSDGIYTLTYFSDASCSAFLQAITLPLLHCEVSTDDSEDDDTADEFSPSQAYESLTCTAEGA